MAEVERDTLKSKFKKGMIPTEEDYVKLFDSYVHKVDTVSIDKIVDENNTPLSTILETGIISEDTVSNASSDITSSNDKLITAGAVYDYIESVKSELGSNSDYSNALSNKIDKSDIIAGYGYVNGSNTDIVTGQVLYDYVNNELSTVNNEISNKVDKNDIIAGYGYVNSSNTDIVTGQVLYDYVSNELSTVNSEISNKVDKNDIIAGYSYVDNSNTDIVTGQVLYNYVNNELSTVNNEISNKVDKNDIISGHDSVNSSNTDIVTGQVLYNYINEILSNNSGNNSDDSSSSNSGSIEGLSIIDNNSSLVSWSYAAPADYNVKDAIIYTGPDYNFNNLSYKSGHIYLKELTNNDEIRIIDPNNQLATADYYEVNQLLASTNIGGPSQSIYRIYVGGTSEFTNEDTFGKKELVTGKLYQFSVYDGKVVAIYDVKPSTSEPKSLQIISGTYEFGQLVNKNHEVYSTETFIYISDYSDVYENEKLYNPTNGGTSVTLVPGKIYKLYCYDSDGNVRLDEAFGSDLSIKIITSEYDMNNHLSSPHDNYDVILYLGYNPTTVTTSYNDEVTINPSRYYMFYYYNNELSSVSEIPLNVGGSGSSSGSSSSGSSSGDISSQIDSYLYNNLQNYCTDYVSYGSTSPITSGGVYQHLHNGYDEIIKVVNYSERMNAIVGIPDPNGYYNGEEGSYNEAYLYTGSSQGYYKQGHIYVLYNKYSDYLNNLPSQEPEQSQEPEENGSSESTAPIKISISGSLNSAWKTTLSADDLSESFGSETLEEIPELVEGEYRSAHFNDTSSNYSSPMGVALSSSQYSNELTKCKIIKSSPIVETADDYIIVIPNTDNDVAYLYQNDALTETTWETTEEGIRLSTGLEVNGNEAFLMMCPLISGYEFVDKAFSAPNDVLFLGIRDSALNNYGKHLFLKVKVVNDNLVIEPVRIQWLRFQYCPNKETIENGVLVSGSKDGGSSSTPTVDLSSIDYSYFWTDISICSELENKVNDLEIRLSQLENRL